MASNEVSSEAAEPMLQTSGAVHQPARQKPVVCLTAMPGTADELAGSIIRAYHHGFDVIVGYHSDALEGVTFAELLGATLLHIDANFDDDEVHETITHHAKVEGYPGVLYQGDPTARVDYEQSESELRSDEAYLIDCLPTVDVRERPHVLVAIPAYNEEAAIAAVVSGALNHADDVLVIDDGSTDRTADEARAAGANVIAHERNIGYGAALQTAFVAADRVGAHHLVMIDGDGQHSPEDIPRLLDAATSADIVIGSRLVEGSQTDMPLYRRVGLAVVNVLTNVSMLGVRRSPGWIRDTQSGFRLYTREVIESLAHDQSIGRDMHASTDILYHATSRGFDINEIGTTVRYDVEEANTQNPVTHGLGLVRNILQTLERERPVVFLGVPAVVLLMIGTFLSYATIATGPSLSGTSIAMAVIAGIALVAGLVLGLTAAVSRAFRLHVLSLGETNKLVDS